MKSRFTLSGMGFKMFLGVEGLYLEARKDLLSNEEPSPNESRRLSQRQLGTINIFLNLVFRSQCILIKLDHPFEEDERMIILTK